MSETRARDLANLAGAGATSSTVAYHETARGFTLPAGAGTQNQVISSDGDGTTQWKNTLTAPVISDVTSTKGINRYESATDNGGGTFTVTGSDFGSETSELTATISSDSTGVTNTVGDISCSSVSGTGGTTAVFTITGAESGFSNWTSSLSSSSIYVKVTKQGLASNIVALSGGVNTLSGDPTITVSGTASTTTPSTTSLGSYGGQVAGGGDDSNTKLLLNFDRAGGTDIEDSSNIGGDGHKVIIQNNVVIKASPFGDGKSAMYFNGSDNKLSIPDHDDFNMTGDWTIECWINVIGTGTEDVFGWPGSTTTDSTVLKTRIDSNGKVKITRNSVNNDSYNGATEAITRGRWHHLAVVKSGNNLHIYVDGKEIGSSWPYTTSWTGGTTGHLLPDTALYIGSDNSTYGELYIDEFRIVNGTAVYTGDFDVSTSRLTKNWSGLGTNITDYASGDNVKLLIHSDQSGDSSGNNRPLTYGGVAFKTDESKFGDGSIYWDGSNDYIHAPVETAIGTGVFTFDFWLYPETQTSSNAQQNILDIRGHDGSSFGNGFVMQWNKSDDRLKVYDSVAGSYIGTPSIGITKDTWTHIALERYDDSGTKKLKLYIGGVQDTGFSSGAGVASTSNYSDTTFTIGNGSDGGSTNVIKGYIDEFRFSSVARYNGTAFNSSLPSSPYSSDANTKLLIHGDFAKFTDSSSSDHNIAVTGAFHADSSFHKGIAPAMTWPASLKKTGSAGVYFDGTGDRLDVLVDGSIWAGNWSWECWFYLESGNNQNSDQKILFGLSHGSGKANFGIQTNNKLALWWDHDWSSPWEIGDSQGSATLSDHTWYHVLFKKTSGQLAWYLNGSSTADKTIGSLGSNANMNSSLTQMRIGSWESGGQGFFKGYMDGIRFSSTAITPSLPTQIYGAYRSQDVGTITITGVAGDGGGDVAFADDHTASSKTQINDANVGLTFTDGGAGNNTATITGTLKNITGTENAKFAVKATANEDAERTTIVGGTNFLGITQNTPVAPVLFSARRYMGNELARDINGLGLAPDFVWIKERGGLSSHQLFDSVRGVGNSLNSDGTWVQGSGGELTAFNNDGFSLKASSTTTNEDGIGQIAWCWKSGGAPSGNFPSSLTNGIGNGTLVADSGNGSASLGYSDISNASSVVQSVNTNSGFSITKFTGSASGCTIPHNLGGTPEFFMIKNLDQSQSWACWHKNLSATTQYRISLDLNDGELQESPSGSGKYFPTAPNSTTITCGSDDGQGGSTDEFICYAWKAVSGVSSFGTFEGGGAGSSTTITCNSAGGSGFKPRFKIIKRVDGTGHWWIQDSSTYIAGTNTQGSGNKSLFKADHNNSAFESDTHCVIEDTSTGFIIHTQTALTGLPNADQDTYFYMAFA